MEHGPRRVFVSDCEGPITKNDNAAELCEAFVPDGDIFFRRISLYDDYLAEVVKRPGYKAGDTLRLILPFFKAFGLDNRSMVKFSRRNIEMIPEAQTMLRNVLNMMPAYIVSTSYSHYIRAVCEAMEFPFGNTYSTLVDLDAYPLRDPEKARLKDLHARVVALPDFSIPAACASVDAVSELDRTTLAELDKIFWEIIPEMEINKIIEEINPIGGREKARAIREIAEIEHVALSDVFYVGDSITDVEAFRLVMRAGGIAVSFNGNDWAVKEASFAITARNAVPTGWLAALFLEQGPSGFEDLTMSPVTADTAERISKLSSRIRREVRTEKIGGLG
jgi:energy-converting hydrogenase A subunit R